MHQQRKTPCEPILQTGATQTIEGGPGYACRYCGRVFASKTNMHRHVRQSCKIANSDEGMEKLMEHTLRQRLEAQTQELSEMRAQVTELASLLKGQLAVAPAGAAPGGTVQVAGPATIHNAPVTQQMTNITQTINIMPWDGDRRIAVSVAQMAAALVENARLREYACWPEHELTDPEKAPPYVAELFMDLVKRGHATPESRNVYLNPKRADQALVHLRTGRWEVLSLQEATRLMFEGIAGSIHGVIMRDEERLQLPLEAQNALALAEAMYWDEPDEYARRAKAPMSAHLTNTAPPS